MHNTGSGSPRPGLKTIALDKKKSKQVPYANTECFDVIKVFLSKKLINFLLTEQQDWVLNNQ